MDDCNFFQFLIIRNENGTDQFSSRLLVLSLVNVFISISKTDIHVVFYQFLSSKFCSNF